MKNDIKLLNIFKRHTGIDFQEVNENELLLGSTLNITPRELVLILFDIEREFNIKIDEKDIVEGMFKTYKQIKGVVEATTKRNL